MRHAKISINLPPPFDAVDPDPRILFCASDAAGCELEVVAVELDDGALMVIHAMPVRAKTRQLIQEVDQ